MKGKLYPVTGLLEGTGKGRENAAAVRHALRICRNEGWSGLRFEHGVYELYNDKALSLYRQLLDGDISPFDYRRWKAEKNALIDWRGPGEFILDGGGATLLFDGLIQPLAIAGAEKVSVRDLTVDWIHPPFSTGRVLGVDGNFMTLALSPGCRPPDNAPVVSFQNADPKTTRPGGICIFEGISGMRRQADGSVRVACGELGEVRPGMFLILRHIYSFAPALHFSACAQVAAENVELRAAPGMGVIAHGCGDLTFRRIRVLPGEGRPMSTNCDATHFISCSGSIRLTDCEFEAMGDDAANVHGFYLIVKELFPSAVTAALEVSTQDFLPDYPSPGDRVELVKPDTLAPFAENTVEEVREDERTGLLHIRFAEPLPGELLPGDCLANASKVARLLFERCHVRNIRGRAVLIQTRGAVVRDCLFEHCTGPGVHIDTATGWWESIGARDVDVSRNRFIDCGYGSTKYCDAVGVVIEAECENPVPGIHRNIRISGNVIQGLGDGIKITCADNVAVTENDFIGCREPVTVSQATNITVRDNRGIRHITEAPDAG